VITLPALTVDTAEVAPDYTAFDGCVASAHLGHLDERDAVSSIRMFSAYFPHDNPRVEIYSEDIDSLIQV
jgi:hypothetical protein